MKNLRALLSAAALMAASCAGASASAHPTPLHLNLSRAIKMAMEKNLAVKVDAFDPQIAAAEVTAARGLFDPNFQAGYFHDSSRADGPDQQGGTATLGLNGLTPLGTIYNFGLNTVAPGYISYQNRLQLAVTQPLLQGFGTDVNLAGIRIAKHNLKISEWAFRQSVIDIVTQVVYAYNDLYASIESLGAAKRSRDLALQLVEDEKRRAEIGVKTSLDVTTARSDAAAREEAVILAQSTIEDNERTLKQLVTDDTFTLLETPVEIDPPPMPMVGDVDVLAGAREALTERPDYQEAKLDLEKRHINLVVSRNGALPRLDLNASLNLLGVSAGNYLSSFRFNGNNPNDLTVGAVFQMPIPNNTGRGRLLGAKLSVAQAVVDLQRLEQSIIVDVANAANQIVTSKKRIDSTREALRLAKESLDAGEERLKAGTATTFEVLQLQQELASAEYALIQAEADYRKSISEYDRKTGATLQRHLISID